MLTEIQLSDILQINPPRPKLYISDDNIEVPFIGMSDVSENGKLTNRHYRLFREVRYGYTYFSEGDILFAKITPCTENGKGCHAIRLNNEFGFASTEFHVLRVKDNTDSVFIYQWTLYKPFRVKAAAAMTGSAGQQRVPVSFLETFKIPHIDKPEQSKIAEILSTVDKAIEQTEALIAKQQRIKTGLMQDLLTKGIDENGNLRSEKTHKFKDSPLGRIPEEWEVLTTGEVTESLVPGRDKPNLDGGGIPWITIPDIDNIYISRSKSALSLSTKAIKAFNSRLMPQKTVLMSCVGEFGICAIAEVNLVANQQLHGFICKEHIMPEWLFFQIKHRADEIDVMATQTTIKYLNKSGCESILISLPCISEQKVSISLLTNIEKLRTQHQIYLAKLHSIKTALMQDFLTGKVRVTPLLNDEVEA